MYSRPRNQSEPLRLEILSLMQVCSDPWGNILAIKSVVEAWQADDAIEIERGEADVADYGLCELCRDDGLWHYL